MDLGADSGLSASTPSVGPPGESTRPWLSSAAAAGFLPTLRMLKLSYDLRHSSTAIMDQNLPDR